MTNEKMSELLEQYAGFNAIVKDKEVALALLRELRLDLRTERINDMKRQSSTGNAGVDVVEYATDKQIALMRKMGYDERIMAKMTKQEASKEIESKIGKR